MPFIKQERREAIEEGFLTDWHYGDLCYVFYKNMVDRWKENPGWTIAHTLYKEMLYRTFTGMEIDKVVAYKLAWDVFFIKYVMEYENLNEEENGTI